uniref:Uncharacterized protein n=1 Tax=Octopus bimaculoides TaxID=37653 RepID=A0A0L8HUC8_OCTBM
MLHKLLREQLKTLFSDGINKLVDPGNSYTELKSVKRTRSSDQLPQPECSDTTWSAKATIYASFLIPCQTENAFTCDETSKECISAEQKCNGISECSNGFDESVKTCGCLPHEFQCNETNCVDLVKRCDTVQDCDAGEDEVNCESYVCPVHRTKCKNYLCVPSTAMCNFIDDCGDNSDEENCSRLRRRGFQLIRSTEQPAREINVQVTEHSTDTCTLNVVLGDIQCDKADPLNCRHNRNRKQECFRSINTHNARSENRNRNPMTIYFFLLSEYRSCYLAEFRCNNSECIPESLLCDGIQDCVDGSDETECAFVIHSPIGGNNNYNYCGRKIEMPRGDKPKEMSRGDTPKGNMFEEVSSATEGSPSDTEEELFPSLPSGTTKEKSNIVSKRVINVPSVQKENNNDIRKYNEIIGKDGNVAKVQPPERLLQEEKKKVILYKTYNLSRKIDKISKGTAGKYLKAMWCDIDYITRGKKFGTVEMRMRNASQHSVKTLKTEDVGLIPMYMGMRTSRIRIGRIPPEIDLMWLVMAVVMNPEEKITLPHAFKDLH